MPQPYRLAGLLLTDHEFSVPLDHTQPDGPQISVFAREVADPDGKERPFLVYFQGGPGFEAARPTGASGWMKRALRDYRLLLLDQRGTGRSTPVGTLPGMSTEEQVAYLRHFRADAIVRDAELIRQTLGVDTWSVLGQSFGGFCVVTYLSFAPHGLREAFITGGLPPIGRPTEEVYRATYQRVADRNRRFYARYPQHLETVRAIHARLSSEEIRLPSGDRLTSQRFRQIGQGMGMQRGLEHVFYLLDQPFGSSAFLQDIEAEFSFARNPLYAALHEACYADGVVSGWAAQREYPDSFPAEWFTGEMVYPWMFEESAALRPLAQAAEQLAHEPWPKLYDAERLRANTVPVAAAVYANDMYVEREYSEETAALIGNLRMWLTNEYEHNGLGMEGERVLDHLIELIREPI
ncbi:alpha/beta hydrolase (plasmid) [Deinococcus sp. KNUC1210]|uniref:alpha/beta fold hydrolase n=1 Tax=Deinococcus sp. KNUC1210 TaxID=2917691 RepID=UPI001EF06C74|nr:alpha/beta fold hydrolase [Deinococcus sp. KNUC1210]ULH17145.1 alpha/beta hydrolase [Deinococcus sp. KNUC1210]